MTTNSVRRHNGGRVIRTLALLVALVVPVSSCGGSSDAGSGSAGSDNTDFLACLMVGASGVADRSFNQQAWTALQRVSEEKGIEVKHLVASGSVDYAQVGDQFVRAGCTMIIGQGFETTETIQDLAAANPDTLFAITDVVLEQELPNAVSLDYKIDQASFLAGYAAAGMSSKGAVGVVGNMNIPPVELYLDGWVAGVRHYNEVHEAEVRALGWNPEKRTGTFVGNFTDTGKAGVLTQSEIDQGADVILPLLGGDQAIRAAGGPDQGYYMVWPDTDGCVANPPVCDLLLTSVLKNIDTSLAEVVSQAADGDFAAGVYEGTLENGGVGLAEFHEVDDQVPDALRSELEDLREQIIAGKVSTS